MELGRLLANRLDVRFWSDGVPHPWFTERGVRQINQLSANSPQGGTVIFSGVHVQVGEWLKHAAPNRVVVRYNLPNHGALFTMIEQVRDIADLEPEIVFVSRSLQAAVGLPGRIESSMIQLDDFLALSLQPDANRPFTIGRASRDVPEKHHSDDAALYQLLAAQGHRIRIMGGTCLEPQLRGVAGIELLPVGFESMAQFLGSLNVMFYRTGSFYEAYGRVIFEAMASGLPVVASTRGGYAESVVGDHGVTLIRTQEEALTVLQAMSADTTLRRVQGHKARERAIELHGKRAIEACLKFY